MIVDGVRIIDGEPLPLIKHTGSTCYDALTGARDDHGPCDGTLFPVYSGDPTVCICPCHDRP
jgi:hypothetical protein